jgi:hypothetical protein
MLCPVPWIRPTVVPVVRPTFSSFVPIAGGFGSTFPVTAGSNVTLSCASVLSIRVSQTLPKPSPATIIPTAGRFCEGAVISAPP